MEASDTVLRSSDKKGRRNSCMFHPRKVLFLDGEAGTRAPNNREHEVLTGGGTRDGFRTLINHGNHRRAQPGTDR